MIKINKTNLTKGVFDHLLYNILKENIDDKKFDNFCKMYVRTINNKTNRSFPSKRNSYKRETQKLRLQNGTSKDIPMKQNLQKL